MLPYKIGGIVPLIYFYNTNDALCLASPRYCRSCTSKGLCKQIVYLSLSVSNPVASSGLNLNGECPPSAWNFGGGGACALTTGVGGI